MDLLDLKESLHGVDTELADKLASLFEKAVQDASQTQQSTIPEIRQLVHKLSVQDMTKVVQHLDDCQTKGEPVQWNLLQSTLDLSLL